MKTSILLDIVQVMTFSRKKVDTSKNFSCFVEYEIVKKKILKSDAA